MILKYDYTVSSINIIAIFTNSTMAPSAVEKFSCPINLAVLADTVNETLVISVIVYEFRILADFIKNLT